MKNDYCEVLGIEVPTLERVKNHPEASTFGLFIVALLERGQPMTLPEVASRFAEAGVMQAERALLSLRRCRPGRAPVFRDEDRYHLDPHNEELVHWVVRLSLRPPRVRRLKPVRVEPEPLPGVDIPLTIDELDQAWKEASLGSWSAQRLTLAVLEAVGGPMHPEEVVDFAAARTSWHRLRAGQAQFKRRGSAIKVLPDGRWSIADDAGERLVSARKAVRERLEVVRLRAARHPDSAEVEATMAALERERVTHAAELAKLPRVLLYGFPAKRPEALALLDVRERELVTLIGDEMQSACGRLAAYDIIGAMDVRPLVRALGFAPGERRLVELGPPQKTKKLNQRGRTLKITTALLIQGSCGINRPFGPEEKLAEYLHHGQPTKLRRRLEANVKSLFALYEYARLHGKVRLRWGFLDERIPASWVHRDEVVLYDLKATALNSGSPLEVVVGSAPGWADPWSRKQLAYVVKEPHGGYLSFVDAYGQVIDEDDIQLARLPLGAE